MVRQELLSEKGIVSSRRTVQRALEPYRRNGWQLSLPGLRSEPKVESLSSSSVPLGFNNLLAALGARDLDRLKRHLRDDPAELGTVLFEVGAPVDRVYFPQTAIVAQQIINAQGRPTAATMVGGDGVVGLGACLAGGVSITRHVVLMKGIVYSLTRASLLDAMKESQHLRDVLGSYTGRFIAETLQTAACIATHTTEERMARAFLGCLDCGHGLDLTIADDVLATVVGVSKKQLVVSVRTLQSLGLLRCREATYTILNRSGLEDLACECYGVVKSKYDRSGT